MEKRIEKKEFRPLTIPKVTWEKKGFTGSYGELIVQPLEPGFGLTLGNALRRILLGSVEGAAVTSVIIKGVNNEFSSIPGVVEDVMHLVLNIKGIVVSNTTGQPGKMRLTVKGESVARVSDIVVDDHLKLINNDHVIAHVSSGGELSIEFFVETGRGYLPAQWPADKSYQEDGRIYLDALFSPILRVTFDIEKTRVGQHIDYDKLVLKVQTNQAESPVNALHYAVSVLRTQLENFLVTPEIDFNNISRTQAPAEKIEKVAAVPTNNDTLKGLNPQLLLSSIDELELSVRARNCLINTNVKRILDLVNLVENDILKIRNFGKKTLDEVKESMAGLGLSFEMGIQEEDVKKALASSEHQ